MIDKVFQVYSNLGEFLSFSTRSFIKQLLFHDCKRILHKNKKQLQFEQTLYGFCWQEIPIKIMEIIVQRLSLSDRIRLGIVCKSWRSLVNICAASQFPWLTLPHNPNKKQISFYDLNVGEVHNMKLPKALQGAVCWSSSKGWLVMAKEMPSLLHDIIKVSIPSFHDILTLISNPEPDTEIFLFNPISRALVQLPSLSTIPSYYQVVWSLNEGYNTSSIIHKIELSSADTKECIVAAVLLGCDGSPRLVAFCRPGDKQWSIFRDKDDDKEDNKILDILFYKGTLYVLRYSTETKHVENHTFGLVDCQVSLKFIPSLNHEGDGTSTLNYLHDNFGIAPECSWNAYLVESTNGELLLISRSSDYLFSTYNDDEGNPNYVNLIYKKTNAFKVFKMDPNTGHLSRLQSLGDQVLFLTYGGSLSCWAKDFLGVQGNCIYFVDDLDYSFDDEDPLLSRESGVYYLEDGRIERSFPSVDFPSKSRMSWFTPVL